MGLVQVAYCVVALDVLTVLSLWLKERNKKYILYIFFVLFGFFFTIRTFEFPDTKNYYMIFQDVNNYSNTLELNNVILINIFKHLPFGFKGFCFCYVIFNELILIKFAKNIVGKNDNFIEIVMILLASYFSYFGYLYNGTIMRQGVAMSFILLAFSYLLNHENMKMVFCFIVAFLFHYSAIVGLIIFFVSRITIKKRKTYYIWYMLIIISWAGDISLRFYEIFKYLLLKSVSIFPFMSRYAYYVVYAMNIRTDGRESLKDLVFLVIALICLLFLKNRNEIYESFLKVFMTGVTAMVLLNCLNVGYRFYDYFLLFEMGMVAILYNTQTLINKKQFGMLVICVNMILLIAVVRFLQSVA